MKKSLEVADAIVKVTLPIVFILLKLSGIIEGAFSELVLVLSIPVLLFYGRKLVILVKG